jgi:hypothetical protein
VELENKRKEVEVIPNVKYVNINRRGKNVSKTLIENVNVSDAVIALSINYLRGSCHL